MQPLPDSRTLLPRLLQACKKESDKKCLSVSLTRPIARVAKYLGLKEKSVHYYCSTKQTEKETVPSSTSATISRPSMRQSAIDSFDKCVVKNAAVSLLAQNKNLDLKGLRSYLKTEKDLDISKFTLWKTLHALGFRYGRVDRNKMGLYERPDIVKRRINYLRQIDQYRKAGKNVIYLDETWVDTHTYPKKQWIAPEGQQQRRLPAGKGQRFVILHCGGKDGFLQDCDLVFRSKHNDGRDYHGEMNGELFQKWVEETLLPALPRESVVVMDNASYHSVQEPGSRAPTTATVKADMQEWLRGKGVSFDPALTKKELYTIVQKEKEMHEKDYRIDRVLSQHGHKVLRLPPYHCDLNPIELIWSDLKGYVSRNNSSFKVKDVEKLIHEGIAYIDKNKWAKACDHVLGFENKYWVKDNIQGHLIQPVIIHLGNESDDETEDDSADDEELADVDEADA